MDAKTPTPEELKAGLRSLIEIARAIHQTVVDAGALGAPESIIRLALAERGLSDRVAASIIESLVAGKLVERRHHALIAVL